MLVSSNDVIEKIHSDSVISLNNTEYFNKRGFSNDLIKKCELGYLPNGLLPYSHCIYEEEEEILKSYKYVIPNISNKGDIDYLLLRKDEETNFMPFEIEGTYVIGSSAQTMWNEKAIYNKHAKYVFVTEGWADALSLIDIGYEALALNKIVNVSTLWKLLKKGKFSSITFIAICDNDYYGDIANTNLKKIFRKLNYDYALFEQFPCIIKDCNEWLQLNREEFKNSIDNFMEDVKTKAIIGNNSIHTSNVCSEYEKKIQIDLDCLHDRFKHYTALRKKYFSQIDPNNYKQNPNASRTNTVWICWLQGMKNAPDIVKSCYNSLISNLIDYKVEVLTSQNFRDYVILPEIIIQKWEKKSISDTAFSNLLRLELLIKYGGIWLDSTVLCTTNKLPDYITETSLFVYSNWKWISGDVRPVSLWLISAKSDNIILKAVRDYLIKYWQDNDTLFTYFIFHMFWQMAIELFPAEWGITSKISNLPPHMMQFELSTLFSEARFEQLVNMSGIHKLTYKLSDETMQKKDTFYKFILNKYKDYK